jgi:hydrogenase nickel incorporation protein HypA/HybF
MHELSIADALVRQVQAVVMKERAARAVSVAVDVGSLSGVDPEALSAAFPLVAEGLPEVACAALQVNFIAATAVCGDCGDRHEDSMAPACPKCGSAHLVFSGGRDLTLRSVELDFDD